MEAALENSYADELRRQRMGGSEVGKEAKLPHGRLASGAEGEPSSLRERVMQARRALDIKERAKEKLKKAAAPAKQGTSQLLKMAWLNLIDSVGLTLIYINAHVFLRWVLGDTFFCKLGEEWIPKQAAAAGGEAAKTAGKGIGIIEVMVLFFLDLAVLFAILMSLAWIVLIVAFMSASWLEKLKWIWEAFQLAGIGAFKTLLSLF